ncbi:hypothetical protein Cmtc_17260 [Cupriavidus sp. TKC]|uniref:MarR family winged helix-turn-helix transcriptional regulator n=1 Tax=Cupriavidus sp. TKC TaxID=2880159 RepID=UPI0025A91881|nr:MarR family transcriptional regulator [Cupriavidus sp. TKC]GMG90506.1 hypothetical protein Cmtc_17260 [Cupriavidus sp. TKC]
MSIKKSLDLRSWHSTVLGRLARAYHASTNGFERYTGMPSTRWRLLFLIYQKGDCTQKDLTRQIGVDAGAITRQIKQLDLEALVKRNAHPEDNRLTVVRLTEAGIAEVERVLARRAAFLQVMMKGASADEIDAFLIMLDRIAENLDQPDVLHLLDTK